MPKPVPLHALDAAVEVLPVANHDTCDACGQRAVQAHVRIVIDTGEHGTHDLQLCWHHARVRGYAVPTEYREELREDNRNKGSDHA
jgi:hypothetical protein